jgi:hypothetical protein
VLFALIRDFNRPKGNITGIAPFVTVAIRGKRLEPLVPRASTVALLTNPNDQASKRSSAIVGVGFGQQLRSAGSAGRSPLLV